MYGHIGENKAGTCMDKYGGVGQVHVWTQRQPSYP